MTRQEQTSRAGRVLVVEHDGAMRELLRRHLGQGGYDVHESGTGHEALARIQREAFDVMMFGAAGAPELDGVTLCRAARTRGPNIHTPILMVSARNSEADRVLGLESGADDYLTKPFGVRELLARVRAVLRRTLRGSPQHAAVAGTINLDPLRRHVSVRGTRLELTRQEFDILALLVSHPDIVFSRAALLSRIWGGDRDVTVRTVDAAISRLRRKVERDPDSPELIRTTWGIGYRFTDPER